MKKIAFISALFLCALLHAQHDTLKPDTIKGDPAVPVRHVDRPAVNIVSYKIRYVQSAARKDYADSSLARLYPAGNLSDLLTGSGLLTLKTTTPGGLGTMSMRGANSMQTPIMWNGINLQNINNNTVDLALLPTFLFDFAAVSPGGTSAEWGNGAVGGVIQVGSSFLPLVHGRILEGNFINARVVSETGSFGQYMNGIQIGIGREKWHYDLRLYRQQMANNFTYRNIAIPGSPLDTLEHGNYFQQGGMLKAVRYTSEREHIWRIQLWVQETKREIPPTMLQGENESTQQDYAMRFLAEHLWWRSSTSIVTKFAVIHEGLYYDPGYSLQGSNTDAWTAILSSVYTMHTSHHKKLRDNWHLQAGLNVIGSTSTVTEFIPHTNQLRSALFVSASKYYRDNDELNVTIRQEFVNDKPIEPVGNIWYYRKWKEWFGTRICLSHNYRIPTFNDLYWQPGGNPDLKAETSWCGEFSIEFEKKWRATTVKYVTTAYTRWVNDMITWVPYASYWSPVNVAAVWSRGVEHRLRIDKRWWGDWRTTFVANADYVRSTYEKTYDAQSVSVGKQLIYVPAWFGMASFTLEFKGFYVTYAQTFNDLRFTTADHREWLPAYTTGNASIGWSKGTFRSEKRYSLNIFFRCNNITNEEFQSVAWRPMPGRSFTFGMSLSWSKRGANDYSE